VVSAPFDAVLKLRLYSEAPTFSWLSSGDQREAALARLPVFAKGNARDPTARISVGVRQGDPATDAPPDRALLSDAEVAYLEAVDHAATRLEIDVEAGVRVEASEQNKLIRFSELTMSLVLPEVSAWPASLWQLLSGSREWNTRDSFSLFSSLSLTASGMEGEGGQLDDAIVRLVPVGSLEEHEPTPPPTVRVEPAAVLTNACHRGCPSFMGLASAGIAFLLSSRFAV
jgi:hypothetical protein